MEDLEIAIYSITDAKTAHFYSREYGKINHEQIIQKNLKRWKREFKKSLDVAIKEGKFKCLVSIPLNIQPIFIDPLEEEFYGSEIFVEWLKEKGYQVKVDLQWFVIEW